jgi:hypothetical protein
MEEIFLVFAVFAVGFLCGWEMRERAARKYVEKFLEENLEELERNSEEPSVNILIEKHGEMYYVFHKEDSSFIAQGKNRIELEKALAKVHPGKKFFATPENLKEVGFK